MLLHFFVHDHKRPSLPKLNGGGGGAQKRQRFISIIEESHFRENTAKEGIIYRPFWSSPVVTKLVDNLWLLI